MKEVFSENDTRLAFSPCPHKKGIVGKILLIVFIMVILAFPIGILIIENIRLPSSLNNEYYIIDFEKSDKTLTEEEKEALIKYCDLDSISDYITITKIAYQHPFRHESDCYVFFTTGTRYVYHHICMQTGSCKIFNSVRRITEKYYNLWEDNEKHIEYTHDERVIERNNC